MSLEKKREQHERRKRRIRGRALGTAQRPRLAVFRSAKHIYAQVIDDDAGKTVAFASSLAKDVRGVTDAKKLQDATKVGEAIAKACIAKGVKAVVFDRGGYQYHGRVSALADAARKAGLEF